MKLVPAVATLVALAAPAAHAFPQYDIVALTPNGESGRALAINREGVVVGCYHKDPASMTAFSWKQGTLTDLGPGCAEAVNEHGVIAGIDAHGGVVVWNGSTRPTPLGFGGDVTGINEGGTIVGSTPTAAGGNTPWMYANGVRSELPSGGSPSATANGVNNAGEIIIDANGQGFVYKAGQLTAIPGIDGAARSLPNAINDAGTVVGGSSSHGPAPYIYQRGATRSLPGGASYSYAVALNDNGLVLGSGEGIYGYVVEADGTNHTLAALAGAGWSHLEGEAINDAGWIVGSGNGPANSGQPFLLLPREAAINAASVAQRRAAKLSKGKILAADRAP